MRTVSEILILGLVFFLGVIGLYQLVQGVAYSNNNLDNESQSIISDYNSFYSNVKTNGNEIYNSTNYDNQVSGATGVDAFYRSVAEAKASADKFSIAKDILWDFPKALIASLPMVPITFSQYILSAIYGVMGAFAFISIFRFWFGGQA